MTLLPAHAFRPDRLRLTFSPDGSGVRHNFDRDLHVFVLWERCREQWDRIQIDLADRFRVLDRLHIAWSEAHIDNNFLRLYGSPPQATPARSKRREHVGGGPFMVVAVEDLNPRYGYDRTFSGKVEIVNRNVVAAKLSYRQWTGGGFQIHSSNSLAEFYRDATLLLGAERVDALCRGHAAKTPPGVEALARDLSGSEGWPTLEAMFRHLERCSDAMVLRNHETLPDHLPDGDADLDVLCRDPEDFAALVAARVAIVRDGKYACTTRVGDAPLPIDLRFVGDGYYDETWQHDMLRRAVLHRELVRVPSPDDLFFSLLYHAKVHKHDVKAAYVSCLASLARTLGFDAFDAADVTSDEAALKILVGFLSSTGYRVSAPLDPWVGWNRPFARRLRSAGAIAAREHQRVRMRVSATLSRLPLLWRWHARLAAPAASAWRALRRLA